MDTPPTFSSMVSCRSSKRLTISEMALPLSVNLTRTDRLSVRDALMMDVAALDELLQVVGDVGAEIVGRGS